MGLKQFVCTDTNQSGDKGRHHYLVLILDHEAAEAVTLELASKLVDCGHITASYIGFP